MIIFGFVLKQKSFEWKNYSAALLFLEETPQIVRVLAAMPRGITKDICSALMTKKCDYYFLFQVWLVHLPFTSIYSVSIL